MWMIFDVLRILLKYEIWKKIFNNQKYKIRKKNHKNLHSRKQLQSKVIGTQNKISKWLFFLFFSDVMKQEMQIKNFYTARFNIKWIKNN